MVDERSDEQKLAADDAATGGVAQGADGSATETTAPAFDAAKIDLSDPDVLSRLSDEELAKVEEFNKTGVAPKKGAEQSDTPNEDTAKTGEAAAAEKAASTSVKYAGKYASTDDLAKGVSEIGKKLGVDVSAFIEAAKESGEFKSLESLYKRLEKTLSERGSAATTEQQGTQPAPVKDTAKSATPETDPEVVKSVTGLTMQQLAASSLAQRMQEKGLTIPKNMEEFETLTEINPYFAMEFKQVFQETYRANMEQAKGYIEAERTVEGTNASVVDTDVQAVKKFAEENGFKLSDDEIATAKSAALANPFNYETKYGHKFLRANAVRDQFMVSVLPTKLKEIAVNKEIAGRQQAVSDLEKAKKREVSSVGTSSLSTKTRTIQKMPDLTDPAVIASLPDEALNDPEGYFRKQGFR